MTSAATKRRRAASGIRKRDGTVVPFDSGRIAAAVLRAAREAGRADPTLAGEIAAAASEEVGRRFPSTFPGIEDVQNAVEETLLRAGEIEVARAYAVYRTRRAELRDAKRAVGVRDELKLSLNAIAVLRERYLAGTSGAGWRSRPRG